MDSTSDDGMPDRDEIDELVDWQLSESPAAEKQSSPWTSWWVY